jgi:aspartyl-tRNA(Asn)/glutamyl-tRNA(Gln) amidotransferase subunit C
MSQISLDDVKKLARLAKISITDEEAKKYQAELDAILGYVKQLDAIDTTGVEPTSQVTGLVNVTRPDSIVEYGVSQDELLKNAPDTKDSYLKVKRML